MVKAFLVGGECHQAGSKDEIGQTGDLMKNIVKLCPNYFKSILMLKVTTQDEYK